MSRPAISSLGFFSRLRWLDGKPLQIEEYRRHLFESALDTLRPDGTPVFNLVLVGRAKKNNKTLDLILGALYVLVIRRSVQGSDGFILANDVDQAGDDLALAKKLIAVNPDLSAEIEVLATELKLRDGSASLKILPARDAAGAHGKTGAFVGFDEIHGYRDWSVIEALQPDPTRADALMWVTSYASLYNSPGAPLHDLMSIGRSGRDPRMLFSWFSGDYCTDPNFADLEPELRANPSMASWAEGRGYLVQQRARLPTHRFRRLHLNLPGAPDHAAFSADLVMAAIVAGRRQAEPIFGADRPQYCAFVDMSGGSSDDATLAIAHYDAEHRKAVLDCLVSQTGAPPFSPRAAVRKFADVLKLYGLARVTGDAYAGETFRQDFSEAGISYEVSKRNKSEIYDAFEPVLNAGEVELLDHLRLQEQLLTLVVKGGGKIDHQTGDHDDFANAACGAITLVHPNATQMASWGIFSFYKEEAAKVAKAGEPRPDFGYEFSNNKPTDYAGLPVGHELAARAIASPANTLRIRPPTPGPSQLTGAHGQSYLPAPDGSFLVDRVTAAALTKPAMGSFVPWEVSP